MGYNWLAPLLAPLRADPMTVAVPLVDQVPRPSSPGPQIEHTTFRQRPVYHPLARPVGVWEWGLLYKEARWEQGWEPGAGLGSSRGGRRGDPGASPPPTPRPYTLGG